MGRELRGVLHNERPLGERQAEAGESTVATGNRVTEAHQQQETDPVEQECHWKCLYVGK